MTQYPQRDGEPDCRDYLRTGRCKYGESCKYHHPIGGAKTPTDPREPPFPIRPNEPPCQYYLKHGTCKFGQTCKFHHPAHILTTGGTGATVYMNLGNINLLAAQSCQPCGQKCNLGNDNSNSNGHSNDYNHNRSFVQLLPQRPGEADCIYFLRNGRCKYGATCKYHHPTDTFSLDPNLSRSPSQQTHYQNGLEKSVLDGAISRVSSDILLNHHQSSRKNSSTQEVPVATHVLYSSEGSIAVVPVSQTSAFQHLRGSTLPNGYAHETLHRKGGRYRKDDRSTRNSSPLSFEKGLSGNEFIPASFQHQSHKRRDFLTTQEQYQHTDKEDGDSSFTALGATDRRKSHSATSRSYTNLESSLQDTLSTSPSDVGRQWSSVSTSSSCQSNENLWDDNSTKRNSDFVCGDILHLGGNSPDNMPTRGESAQMSRTKNFNESSNMYRSEQPQNFDDGLSMMTSALLTMLDSPEEEQAEIRHQDDTNSFYSDTSSSQGSPLPSRHGSKTIFDTHDPSSTWFSNFVGIDSGMKEPAGHGDSISKPLPTDNRAEIPLRWLDQSSLNVRNFEPKSVSSQLFL